MAIVPDASGVNINSREVRAISLYGFELDEKPLNFQKGGEDVSRRRPGKPYEGEPHVRFGR